jgi:hypothetical protein
MSLSTLRESPRILSEGLDRPPGCPSYLVLRRLNLQMAIPASNVKAKTAWEEARLEAGKWLGTTERIPA